ncbi:hypothetical protein [Aurantimonas manganoxydans]|uniref:Uncharacterized protein n=1 Tax=Aurantimonas manganoxydans TaxID=651183 RepID=A0A0P0Z5Y0_9HYPH|nr:hypothetical protein [Aurantimonas manganoxydans]BAT29560.1 hypothetical protein [Aurantimonas manganoxydans SI85-9A1]
MKAPVTEISAFPIVPVDYFEAFTVGGRLWHATCYSGFDGPAARDGDNVEKECR